MLLHDIARSYWERNLLEKIIVAAPILLYLVFLAAFWLCLAPFVFLCTRKPKGVDYE